MALKASQLKVGDTHSERVCENLTRTQIVMYAGASGDYNPLHSDEVYVTQVAGYPTVFAHGMLSMGDVLPTTIRKSSGKGTGQRAPISKSFLDRYSDAYRAELDAFVTAIETKTPVSPGFLDGLRALELA